MALAQSALSTTIEDEPGERQAMPIYLNIDDTNTLADIQTAMGAIISLIDGVTDGKIVRARLVVNVTLPGGLKASPVTGSDNEETGLFTFDLTGAVGKAFAVDVPAVAQAILDPANMNRIDLTVAAAGDFAARLYAVNSDYQVTINTWSDVFEFIRTAVKTFRKHRRAAKRV